SDDGSLAARRQEPVKDRVTREKRGPRRDAPGRPGRRLACLTGSAQTAQYRAHGSRCFARRFRLSPPVITGLDHVVVAARDLDAAVRAYEVVLGRRCEWRTDAHGGGAQVAAFGLANLSLELMAPAGDGPMADRLRAVLEAQGEGLASLAFVVGDI